MNERAHAEEPTVDAETVNPAEVRQLLATTRSVVRSIETQIPPKKVKDPSLGDGNRYSIPVGSGELYVFVPRQKTNPTGGDNPDYSIRTYPGGRPPNIGWRIDLFPDGRPAAWEEDAHGGSVPATEPYQTATELLQEAFLNIPTQHIPPGSSEQ